MLTGGRARTFYDDGFFVGVVDIRVGNHLVIFCAARLLSVGLLFLVTAFLGFEFAIVSAIPLISELDPGARAQMVGRAMGFTTFVRAAVTLIATGIYLERGFGVTMAVASATGLIAVLLAAFVMEEPSVEAGPTVS